MAHNGQYKDVIWFLCNNIMFHVHTMKLHRLFKRQVDANIKCYWFQIL